jgi:hypothetical protein
MKNFRNKLLLLLGFVASISVASAVDKDDKFTPPDLDNVSTKQTTDGVTIGAAPYNTEALARTAFGKLNPYEHGILPVLVMIRNDSKDAIRLSEMKVEYIDRSRERADAIPANEVKYTRAPKRPSYGPGPIPGIRLKGKNPLAAEVIEVRGFAAKMLPPGESAYGFFYFQSGYRDGSRLYLTGLQNASTGKDLFYFDIPLD